MEDKPGLNISCDSVLFDFDGVLVDSTGNILRHWKAWADRHSIDMNEINRAVHGMRAVETMRIVAPHLDIEKEARLFMESAMHDFEGIIAYEGASALLSLLPLDAWGVVTSARGQVVKMRMVKTGLPVPEILIAADDVKEGKPSPEPYLTGARMIGVSPERCVVIEDAPAGILAGKRAGMRVVAVSTTHPKEELLASGADFIVKRLADISVHDPEHGHRIQLRLP